MAFDLTEMGAMGVEEARSLSEMIFKTVKEDSIIEDFYTVIPNIEHDKYIPIIGNLTDIMQTITGSCALPTGGSVPVSTKKWTPARAGQSIEWCKDTFEARMTAFLNMRADLLARYDLTNTELGNFLIREFADGTVRALKRLGDFGDTDSSLIGSGSGAENITTALGAEGVGLMNTVDGIWKQGIASVTAGDTKRVTISENGLATYALQNALADDTAVNTFSQMILDGGAEIENGVIHCTQSLWNNYFVWAVKNKLDVSQATEERDYKAITLANYGVTVVARPDWDKTIKSYFDNGTVLDMPHRAMYVSKENLLLGVPEGGVSANEAFYDRVSMKFITRGELKMDVKIALDEAIVLAY